jgi:glutathione synthase/RimK-type ligase-like ATP-grasp enzyme
MQYQLTQKITQRDFDMLYPIGPAPMYFQKYIEKKYEYRVTIVGDQVFSCQIDSQKAKKAATKIDWRAYDIENTPHYSVELPESLNGKLLHLARNNNLNYCAIDLIEDVNGQYWGLDINPMGQYLWIEDLTDAPISAAIAKWLVA